MPLEAQFVVSSPGLWRNNSWKNSIPNAHPSSTLCRPGLALIASVICCVQPQTQTLESQFHCRWDMNVRSRSAVGDVRKKIGVNAWCKVVASILSHVVRATFQLPVVRSSKSCTCGNPSRRRGAGRPTNAPPLFHWHPGRVGGGGSVFLPGEQLCAFLDDVYLLCDPSRVRFLYDLLAAALARVTGIQLHEGKTTAWNRAGVIPDNIDQLGPEVWQPEGITVLGTPIGTEQCVSQKMEERLAKEREMWAAIPTVPDLQCAWQLLLQNANPRANHTMRTTLPSVSAAYCHAHDEGMWDTAKTLLDGVPEANEAKSQQLSGPFRSAVRCAPRCVLGVVGRCFAHDQPAHTKCGPRRAAQTESGGTHREMYGRDARRIIRVGPKGLLVETFMARVARGQAPSEDRDSRARRVATRLAVLGFFRP